MAGRWCGEIIERENLSELFRVRMVRVTYFHGSPVCLEGPKDGECVEHK